MHNLLLTNTDNIFTQIDDEDVDKVLAFSSKLGLTWKLSNFGYAIINKMRLQHARIHFLHNIIMPPPAGFVIDHIDRNKLNNQKSNFRIATEEQNSFNRKLSCHSTTGLKGITKEKFKWKVRISFNTIRITLGTFYCKIEAIKVYNDAALKHHGDFASLNSLEGVICNCYICRDKQNGVTKQNEENTTS